MLLNIWLKSWKSSWITNRRQATRGRNRRLHAEFSKLSQAQRVEPLENRVLLATVNWIGGSGDWHTDY